MLKIPLVSSSSASKPSGLEAIYISKASEDVKTSNIHFRTNKRSGFAWTTVFLAAIMASWSVYHYQFEYMPEPLSAEQAGETGFSELEAIKHVQALTELGPRPVGSNALDRAQQYVLAAAEKIKEESSREFDVEVDFFHAKSGANRLGSGDFKGITHIYSDLNHILLRILPKNASETTKNARIRAKYSSETEENAILLSSHIDSVFVGEGAGECSSIAVMLEVARAMSQQDPGFKDGVIFLFNTGEEDGLNGAHSFITQHPWSNTVRVAIDLEAMGIGGKSGIFQAGSQTEAIENFAAVAKYPSGQIVTQDLFSSGVITSTHDFEVYKEIGGVSGLDFAYMDRSAVYHTKNDKLELLKPGSLQHLGENMLPFLLQPATSSNIPEGNALEEEGKSVNETAIYFDILGKYMVLYSQRFANMLYISVILQSLLIWSASLVMGGFPAVVSLASTCLSVILVWVFSISFSVIIAFILPQISSTPVPYVASPWLVIGLFGAPAFLGALTGQHLGYTILKACIANLYCKRKEFSPVSQAELIKMEAERWLFKAGFLQWLILLVLGTYYKIGSTYLALVWLVPPAFAYGLLEATLAPAGLPSPLKLATLLIGLAVPVLVSAGTFIRLASVLVATMVRFDRNPGGTPEWLGNVVLAVFIAVVLCLTLVYHLSYIHLSGTKRPIAVAACALFGLSLILVMSGSVPPFTEDTARPVNVVHVVDATGQFGGKSKPSSYVALFSTTPGKLTKEVEQINEGFICGGDKVIDFVTMSMEYGCLTHDDTKYGWRGSDIPIIHVDNDSIGSERITQVLIDTKGSVRWSLAINAKEIEDFTLKEDSEVLVPRDEKISIDGWHIIQFSGGKNASTKFNLDLYWYKNSRESAHNVDGQKEEQLPLLKLRTDFDRVTPITEKVLSKLPQWCSSYGKSTFPQTLSFLHSLPVNY